MADDHIATAATTVDAPVADVWNALIDPEKIRKYMFGTTVESDWREGSPIKWTGEWKGKRYEDSGFILKAKPPQLLQYTHSSAGSGTHQVTIELSGDGAKTSVKLQQDNNPTDEARKHSEENWSAMLAGLKKLVEGEKTNAARRQESLHGQTEATGEAHRTRV